MAKKKNNQEEENKEPGKPPKKRRGRKRQPKTYKEIKEKAKNSRRKKVKVYLPAVLKDGYHAGEHAQEPPMSEHEISYKDALLAVEIEQLAAKGFTNDQIIEKVAMSRDTFYKKIREEPYFSYAINKHRGISRIEVENALLNSAKGFIYHEQQGTAMGDVVTVAKYALPNVSAQKYYLNNRVPNEWKQKVEPEQAKGIDISKIAIKIKRRE